jgi:hypothetical protein
MSSRGDVPLPYHIKRKGDSSERVNAYKHHRARAFFQIIPNGRPTSDLVPSNKDLVRYGMDLGMA